MTLNSFRRLQKWNKKRLRAREQKLSMMKYVESRLDWVDPRDAQILALQAELEETKKRATSGEYCVQAVLNRGIEWYDSSKLTFEEQVSYKANAVAALKNETLLNELRRYESDLVTYVATQSKDFAEVANVRFGINVLTMLMDRLNDIPDPHKQKDVDEPFSPI